MKANPIVLNLTTLLLAEKEEKRQLYNRLKVMENERLGLMQQAAAAAHLKGEVRTLTGEIAQLDKMLGDARAELAQMAELAG